MGRTEKFLAADVHSSQEIVQIGCRFYHTIRRLVDRIGTEKEMVGVAGFEPAADGYLQTRIKAAPSTVHSSAKLLRVRRNVALLSYTPLRLLL